MRIGLEYVNGYESNLQNTAAQTAAFLFDLEERGGANVLLQIDADHAYRGALASPDTRQGSCDW